MVVYVVVTSFLRNVAFLIYPLFGEISILEIPVVGNFFTFCRSAPPLARPTSSTEPGVLVIRVPTVRGPVTQVLGGRKP